MLVLDPPYQVLEHLARDAITFHQMEEVCNIAQSVLCAGGTAVIFCGTLQMEFYMKKLKDCNLKVDPVPLVCVNSMRSNFIILYSVKKGFFSYAQKVRNAINIAVVAHKLGEGGKFKWNRSVLFIF